MCDHARITLHDSLHESPPDCGSLTSHVFTRDVLAEAWCMRSHRVQTLRG